MTAGWQNVVRDNTSNDISDTQVQITNGNKYLFLLLAGYFSSLKKETIDVFETLDSNCQAADCHISKFNNMGLIKNFSAIG